MLTSNTNDNICSSNINGTSEGYLYMPITTLMSIPLLTDISIFQTEMTLWECRLHH